MRKLLIAGLGGALAVAGAADAQRMAQRGPGAGYPMPGRAPPARPLPVSGAQVPPGRPGTGFVPGRGAPWQMQNGRWIGGSNAPGGWNGYRRPYTGFALPSYWVQPGFAIGNWSAYGLAQPPYGYSWSRYYDDAVLIDARGSVHDTVGGVEWDRYDGYDDDGRADDYPVAPDYPAGREYERRDNGLGGAAIGAVAGGVAGNVIAGRGNRLGGTLIGAGVGAAAGYAIDKVEDRGRGAPPRRGYGAGYPPPAYAPPPPVVGYPSRGYPVQQGGGWVSPDGRTTVTTTGGGYHGGSTTTVVVQSAPVVTTTTTEYYEDHVTYSRPAKRKVYARRRVPTKTICRC